MTGMAGVEEAATTGTTGAEVVRMPVRRVPNPSARREAFLRHFERAAGDDGEAALADDGLAAHRVVAELNESARAGDAASAAEPARRRWPYVLGAGVVLAAVAVVAALTGLFG